MTEPGSSKPPSLTAPDPEEPPAARWSPPRWARSRNAWVVAFFTAYLAVGLVVHGDYGVPLDEPTNRHTGLVTLKYVGDRIAPGLIAADTVFDGVHTPLATYHDRDYGVAFQAPAALIERLLGLDDPREIYRLRHLLLFLVGAAGTFAIFRIGERRFSDWRIGLVGAFLFVLSPRFFAESFFNDKDAVFTALVAISTATAFRFLERPSPGNALGHAVATALAINVRVMGLVIPALTLGVLALRWLRRDVEGRTALRSAAVYLVSAPVILVATWPFLWSNPIGGFAEALRNAATFEWPGWVLYLGEIVPAGEVPWHYVPVWIAVTTPLLHLALFGIGVGAVARETIRSGGRLWTEPKGWMDLFAVGLLLGPILAVMLLGSVVFDGWRHLYFVFPAFVLLALRGFVRALHGRASGRNPALPGIVILVTILGLGHTAVWMVRAHPYQNLYFNSLAGSDWTERFDVDYWGLATGELLEAVLHDADPGPVRVWGSSLLSVEYGALMLPREDRDRIVVVAWEETADYIVSNYRLDPLVSSGRLDAFPPVRHVEVGSEVVASAFRGPAPPLELSDESVDPARAQHIEVRIEEIEEAYLLEASALDAFVRIRNGSDGPVHARAADGVRHLRLSWRVRRDSGDDAPVHLSHWDDVRQDLHWSLQPGDEARARIRFDRPSEPGDYTLEVSLVQEGVAWLHELGMPVAEAGFTVPERVEPAPAR